MHTVIINRKTWLRGKVDSELRKPNGKKCCIGFLASTLGAKNKEITGVSVLADMYNNVCLSFSSEHSTPLSEAYEANDDLNMNDREREKELRTIGKAMGVRFRFIN